jgi:hypothetical protein
VVIAIAWICTCAVTETETRPPLVAAALFCASRACAIAPDTGSVQVTGPVPLAGTGVGGLTQSPAGVPSTEMLAVIVAVTWEPTTVVSPAPETLLVTAAFTVQAPPQAIWPVVWAVNWTCGSAASTSWVVASSSSW